MEWIIKIILESTCIFVGSSGDLYLQNVYLYVYEH